uniref:Uncharacterized protein n=1 Tax=Ditylenchus dipsaci TaxID=166011 RepID=A0A915EES1_9BILA
MAEFMQIRGMRRKQRNLRSPFEECTDEELIRRYRFNRRGLRVICELVEDGFPTTNRGETIPVEIQVCAALNYLASNTFQLHIRRYCELKTMARQSA